MPECNGQMRVNVSCLCVLIIICAMCFMLVPVKVEDKIAGRDNIADCSNISSN